MVNALSCNLQPKKWLNCTVQMFARFWKGPTRSSYLSMYQLDTIDSSIEYFGVFICTTCRRKVPEMEKEVSSTFIEIDFV